MNMYHIFDSNTFNQEHQKRPYIAKRAIYESSLKEYDIIKVPKNLAYSSIILFVSFFSTNANNKYPLKEVTFEKIKMIEHMYIYYSLKKYIKFYFNGHK